MPERDCDREVPRGDTADDPLRLAPHIGVLAGDLGRYHVAVGVAGVAGGPLDHVPGLGHVGQPLADLLATLHGDDFAEFLVAVTQLVVDVPEVLCAVDVRERAPLVVGVFCRGQRAVDVGLGSAVERGERLAGSRVLTCERFLAGACRPFTVDVVSP